MYYILPQPRVDSSGGRFRGRHRPTRPLARLAWLSIRPGLRSRFR